MNTLLTYACEKFIVAKLTVFSDKKGAEEKAERFRKQMMISKKESMLQWNDNNESTIVNKNYHALS
jgi:hypothetical protein